jgi:nicotinamide-nucleotide amidase
MFPDDLVETATALLASLRAQGLKLATAESCTGGLVSGVLTAIPGSSDVLERGFVTYSDAAKIEMLGVPAAVIDRHGAVSAAVALAMAEGALKHSRADLAVSVTGIAGPGGGTEAKPVGLVYLSAERRGRPGIAHRCTFGAMGRDTIRLESVREALKLIEQAVA